MLSKLGNFTFVAALALACVVAGTTNAQIADSIADWSASGTQGENGWTYGYYDLTADGAPNEGAYDHTTDFIPFLNDGTGVPETNPTEVNHWNGAAYDFEGNPPSQFQVFDFINLANSALSHKAHHAIAPGNEGVRIKDALGTQKRIPVALAATQAQKQVRGDGASSCGGIP